MPRTAQTGVEAGYRRCPRCRMIYPASPSYFYTRPRSGRMELCQGRGTMDCRATYFREYAAAKRARGFTGSNRKFGVEVEYIGGADAVADEMNARGLDCEVQQYNHRVSSAWKIVPDGSVSCGYELVSPPLRGEAGRAALRTACEALRAAGATVDASCGLHVHHEVTNLTLDAFQNLYRLWWRAQGATGSLVARSRRDGRWCQWINLTDVEVVESLSSLDRRTVGMVADRIDRYKSLNLQSFPRYGTVEVRQHQGTLNADKMLAWIDYVQALISWASSDCELPDRGVALSTVLAALTASHGLPATTAAYLERRAEALGAPRVAAVPDADDYAADDCADDDDEDDDDYGTDDCTCPACTDVRDRY